MREPSRSFHGEGHVAARQSGARKRGGSRRGRGRSTRARSGRNTRDPSARPSSRQGSSYKPKAKASAAQRESEGIIVPTRGATNNAPGGKGPCGGRVGKEGKREGMAGKTGSNHPDGHSPSTKCDNSNAGSDCGQAAAGSSFPRAVRPHLQE